MKKEFFEEVQMEVVLLDIEDVVTTSDQNENTPGGSTGDDDW